MTDDLPKPYRHFREHHREVFSAYEQLGKAVREAGPLNQREVALVKLAIAVGARLEGATHSHTRRAQQDGIEREALEQVALLACPTVGFPNMMAALSWIRDVTAEG